MTETSSVNRESRSDPLARWLPSGDPTQPFRAPVSNEPPASTPPVQAGISTPSQTSRSATSKSAPPVPNAGESGREVANPATAENSPAGNKPNQSAIPREPSLVDVLDVTAKVTSESEAYATPTQPPAQTSGDDPEQPNTNESEVLPWATPISSPSDTAPNATNERLSRRRRKKKRSTVWLAAIAVGLTGVIAFLAHALFSEDSRLQLVQRSEGVAIAPAPLDDVPQARVPEPSPGPAPNQALPQGDAPSNARDIPGPRDVVMGGSSQGSRKTTPKGRTRVGRSLAEDLGSDLGKELAPMPGSIVKSDPAPDAAPTPPEMTNKPDEMARPAQKTTENPPVPDQASLAAGKQALLDALAAFRSGDLDAMKNSVAQAVSSARGTEQKYHAESMEQFMDLVSFYDGAVDRSLRLLDAAESIELTPALTIILVEVTDERIVVKVNGVNRRFTRNQLPLVMVDKLAADSLQNDPVTALAAKSCFHAVAPMAGTRLHRRQSLGWLRQSDAPIPGADRERLIEVIESLQDGKIAEPTGR